MATKETSQRTKDHEVIKEWVVQRDGTPSVVKETQNDQEEGAVLRIDFPRNENPDLEEITWDRFFEIFDSSDIEFLYQEETEDGNKSNFCKFVSAN
ncbi:hypothetical protein J8281_05170 [Aquimarina sp. U1-2]|uniref:hypothetical protein n=1 Tax=Aquimarina sp. U1-2 TaxID=2823141 RepID=UPI001AECFC10|nr:hypothetical protein [Aquimarina sp. U1-2]MBP2831573.1 hypothetical protein [Aquimarina sp. U1-2]